MPYTSSDLLQDLAAMGLTGQETILLHSSMRSIGAAACTLCDARKIFEVTRHVLAPDPECIVTAPGIPPERWQ